MSTKLPIMNKGITFTEIPDEIAVYFEVGNCECRCKGCHSEYLWGDTGAKWMDAEDMLAYAERQAVADTIVLMGGLHNGVLKEDILYDFVVPFQLEGYKVGIYTGEEEAPNWCYDLDYLKVGAYKEELGGLDKETTNQRFYIKGVLQKHAFKQA